MNRRLLIIGALLLAACVLGALGVTALVESIHDAPLRPATTGQRAGN